MTDAPPTLTPGRVSKSPRRKASVKAQNKRYYDANREKILAEARERYQATKHLRPKPASDRPTILYRLYGADGALLYVGITYHFDVRLAQHRSRSRWASLVDHWTTEEYADRRTAKSVETQAIGAEMPRFNLHESTV